MKLCYSEERRGRRVELMVAVTDAHPLLKPFKAKIKLHKDGDYALSIEKNGTQETWEGGVIHTSYLIHTGTYDDVEVPKIKNLLKLNLKSALEKAGFLTGLSEEKVK